MYLKVYHDLIQLSYVCYVGFCFLVLLLICIYDNKLDKNL